MKHFFKKESKKENTHDETVKNYELPDLESKSTLSSFDVDSIDFETRPIHHGLKTKIPTYGTDDDLDFLADWKKEKPAWKQTDSSFEIIEGQDEAINKLKLIINRTKEKDLSSNGILLYGGSATKRLEIAEAFVEEFAVDDVKEIECNEFIKLGNIVNFINVLPENGFLILCDAQKLSNEIIKSINHAIETNSIDMSMGKGSTAKIINIPVIKVNYIVLADKEINLLTAVDYSIKLASTDVADSRDFIQTFLGKYGLSAKRETIDELAKSGMTTVQLRRKLVELRDIAIDKGLTEINLSLQYATNDYSIEYVDDILNGIEFETFASDVLRKNGFYDVQVTKASGDFGVDIIAFKDEIKYAIQCKKYSSPVGIAAVQEVLGSKTMFDCHVGIVLTNNFFTPEAVKLASKNNVLLWDRNRLIKLLQ